MLSGQTEVALHRGWHLRGDRMLDLGRAQVPMGSGSLEHQREGKAADVLAALRPSDTLGEGAGRRLTSGRARESDGGVGGKRIDDTESTKPDALAAPPVVPPRSEKRPRGSG